MVPSTGNRRAGSQAGFPAVFGAGGDQLGTIVPEVSHTICTAAGSTSILTTNKNAAQTN